VSVRAIDNVFDSAETTNKDLVSEVEEVSDPRDRSNLDGSKEREDHDYVKQRLCALFGACITPPMGSL